MSDSNLRKRKGDSTPSQPSQPSQDVAEEPKAEGDFDFLDSAALSKYVRIFIIPVLLAFGVFVYLNPNSAKEIVGLWLESEDLQASPPGPIEEVSFVADIPKRDAVVAAFKDAWRAYERHAMGDDQFHPIGQKGTNLTDAGGIGYTIIDSLDTMMLMGLDADYKRARKWIDEKLSFEQDGIFSTFEVTIRVLGGLLSAYHLSGQDKLYLDKAIDLADRLLPAFNSPSGLPYPRINLGKKRALADPDYPNLVSVAEASTLQLEFRYLSFLTGNEEYWDKAENVMHAIKAARMGHGLASIFMDIDEAVFVPSAIRLGSRGDSHWEYLLKQYIQTNQTEDVYRDMYTDAMDSIHEMLISRSPFANLLYTSELIPERSDAPPDPDMPPELHGFDQLSWRLTPKQDHLVCFFAGNLMLGATLTGAAESPIPVPPTDESFTPTGKRDWETGVELLNTCLTTHDTATGLPPEVVYFRVPGDNMDVLGHGLTPSDWYIKGARRGAPAPYDARYQLRPETIESLFIAYRLTGDQTYRNWGWKIFQAIEKHCRIPTGGYATIFNVDDAPAKHEDRMESFMLSETLKYLYLLFADPDVLPLDKYVLNTEAHPLPIFTSSRVVGLGGFT